MKMEKTSNEKSSYMKTISYYGLSLNCSRRPTINDSKIGGFPYWDNTKEYPTDEKGMPMKLLCQINFSKHRMAKPLPYQGLLQFFISNSQGLYGYDPECPNVQKNFRVVYHASIDKAINKRIIAKQGYPYFGQSENDPLQEEFALSIKKCNSSVHNVTNDFHLLGLPYFIQTENIPANYETLLLQFPTILMPSNLNKGRKYAALWGDCGILKFFIKKGDLEKLKFDDISYHFECC